MFVASNNSVTMENILPSVLSKIDRQHILLSKEQICYNFCLFRPRHDCLLTNRTRQFDNFRGSSVVLRFFAWEKRRWSDCWCSDDHAPAVVFDEWTSPRSDTMWPVSSTSFQRPTFRSARVHREGWTDVHLCKPRNSTGEEIGGKITFAVFQVPDPIETHIHEQSSLCGNVGR